MKRRGRKIVVEGKEYQWKYCGHGAMIWDENDKPHKAELMDLAGIDFNARERGHWKKTCDGMLVPSQIAGWIKEHLQGGPKRSPSEIRGLVFQAIWKDRKIAESS
jgi:hypothetical protein